MLVRFVMLKETEDTNCSTHRFLLNGDLGMSAIGIICSPGRTHMMGPSSLSVGLCRRRLEKVPHGRVLCSSTEPDASRYIMTQKQGGPSHRRLPWWCLYLHKHTHTSRAMRATDLKEGGFLQHADELWEVISHLFIHSTDQADLSHGPGTVCSLGVCPFHLQGEHNTARPLVM